ncbi:hypothetical protein DFH06DRAFT_1230016 [Mycena polygramma]|nr:hypothetical protein DFH06DRAFT_1230016 [Mycena polygramma]
MSPSAIAHVVAFLTRPLVSSFASETISSAQVILTASLASTSSATFTLNATSTPPAPLLAASIGAGIPWTAWLAALGAGSDVIFLFYGPRYVKVRRGGAAVTNIWSEERQGCVVPISRIQAQTKAGHSPLFQQNTSARLRAMLLSARVRSVRREQAAAVSCPTSDSDDSESDYASDSDSDSVSSTTSQYTSISYGSLTSADSPPSTPAKAAVALPVTVPAYRPPFRRAQAVAKPARKPAAKPPTAAPVPMDRSKKDTTAYLYHGGVTRVMTGGVMLGPHIAARS